MGSLMPPPAFSIITERATAAWQPTGKSAIFCELLVSDEIFPLLFSENVVNKVFTEGWSNTKESTISAAILCRYWSLVSLLVLPRLGGMGHFYGWLSLDWIPRVSIAAVMTLDLTITRKKSLCTVFFSGISSDISAVDSGSISIHLYKNSSKYVQWSLQNMYNVYLQCEGSEKL